MAEFWIFSIFLREKCDENVEIHELCKQIAAKYMEAEKKELRAQNAREENIVLKLDVGNLESLCSTMTENIVAQVKLQKLLTEYYEEHLLVTFDIDESEIEKLYSYDEIKIELETRESINVHQQSYWRKLKTATRMEQRKIVTKYRQKEREFLKSQDERINLEDSVTKLREWAEQHKARVQEQNECIIRLVKGSKDLEILYSKKPSKNGIKNEIVKRPDNDQPLGTIGKIKASEKPLYRKGLSSKLILDFNHLKNSHPLVLPKIRTINPLNGLSRLLQQAEAFRKPIQRSPVALPDDPPTPKLLGILKTPMELIKLTESSNKSVSFETDLKQQITASDDVLDSIPSVCNITLSTPISEITGHSELNKNPVKPSKSKTKKPNIKILENIILKPAEVTLPIQLANEEQTRVPKILMDQNSNKKRNVSEVQNNVDESLPKRIRVDTNTSNEVGTQNFADMFLEFSKETTTAEPSKNPIDIMLETKKETKQSREVNINKKKENKNVGKSKANKSAPFDDFEDFFSGLAGSGSENNDTDQCAAEISFDFFGEKDNADDDRDAGSDHFSFQF